MYSRRLAPIRTLVFALAAGAVAALTQSSAGAESLILVEADTGKVLYADNATYPWYPASTTKLMTIYTTLRAIREGRLTFDTLLTVSHNAAAQSPVKMGFPPGTTVTVDNALKMMMVKSANDIAVVVAEGVGGSIENFADMMNSNAQRLGMTQSHFVNPNGLPAEEQIVSARDMAILARALIKEFPEYDYYWHLPGIRMGKMVQRNYNPLLGRYPGADGMKTGFICASGFNLVATATRDGKRLIAVVLGAASASARAVKAAQLLERGFTGNPLAWLSPSPGSVEELQPVNAAPPDLHEEMCGSHRKRPASEDEDDSGAIAGLGANYAGFLSALRAPNGKQSLLQDMPLGEPVQVWTGASPKPAPQGRNAAVDASKATAKPAKATAKAATGASSTSMSPGSIVNNPPRATPGNAAKPKAVKKVAATPAADAKTKSAADKSAKSGDKSSKAAPGKAKPSSPQKTSQKTDKK